MRLMPHPDTTDAAIQPQASQRGLPGMGASAREGRAGAAGIRTLVAITHSARDEVNLD
jgi:hypothetical protein